MQFKTLQTIFLLSLLAGALFSLPSCGANTTITVGYHPPFIPVTFTINSKGEVAVQTGASITTPLGTFSIDAEEATKIQPQDGTLLVIIRHQQSGKTVDTAYRITTGNDEVIVTTNGLTTIGVTNNSVTIDISKGDIRSIEVKSANSDTTTHYGSTPTPSPTLIPTPTPHPAPTYIPSSGYQQKQRK